MVDLIWLKTSAQTNPNFSYQFASKQVREKEKKRKWRLCNQISSSNFECLGTNKQMQNFSITWWQYLEMSILFSICHRQYAIAWYSISRHKTTRTNTDKRLTQLPHLWRFQTHMHTSEFQKLTRVRSIQQRVWLPIRIKQAQWICLESHKCGNFDCAIINSDGASILTRKKLGWKTKWKNQIESEWVLKLISQMN